MPGRRDRARENEKVAAADSSNTGIRLTEGWPAVHQERRGFLGLEPKGWAEAAEDYGGPGK